VGKRKLVIAIAIAVLVILLAASGVSEWILLHKLEQMSDGVTLSTSLTTDLEGAGTVYQIGTRSGKNEWIFVYAPPARKVYGTKGKVTIYQGSAGTNFGSTCVLAIRAGRYAALLVFSPVEGSVSVVGPFDKTTKYGLANGRGFVVQSDGTVAQLAIDNTWNPESPDFFEKARKAFPEIDAAKRAADEAAKTEGGVPTVGIEPPVAAHGPAPHPNDAEAGGKDRGDGGAGETQGGPGGPDAPR
jgi:hypothetical protein